MKKEVEFTLTPGELAQSFCELDDTGMAQFFQAIDGIASKWPMNGGMQWYYVGKRMREAGMWEANSLLREMCSSYEADGPVERTVMGDPTGGLWAVLSQEERDAVRDFAMDIRRAAK